MGDHHFPAGDPFDLDLRLETVVDTNRPVQLATIMPVQCTNTAYGCWPTNNTCDATGIPCIC